MTTNLVLKAFKNVASKGCGFCKSVILKRVMCIILAKLARYAILSYGIPWNIKWLSWFVIGYIFYSMIAIKSVFAKLVNGTFRAL